MLVTQKLRTDFSFQSDLNIACEIYGAFTLKSMFEIIEFIDRIKF